MLFEWRSLDHVAIDEAYTTYNGHAYDCFHINSVDVDADGNLLVSARNTWAVYKLDSETVAFSGDSGASGATSGWGREPVSRGSTTRVTTTRDG